MTMYVSILRNWLTCQKSYDGRVRFGPALCEYIAGITLAVLCYGLAVKTVTVSILDSYLLASAHR